MAIELTKYLPISQWEGGDDSIEISLGEYGMAMAQIDEDEYAIIKGVAADENCNYTEFICDTFSYQTWLDEVHDKRTWIDMDAICEFMGTDRKEVESTPWRLFDALLGYYNYENFFSNAYGYKHYTLSEVLECIYCDNEQINNQFKQAA